MTMARKHLVDVSVTRWYHCVTRAACVAPSCWAKDRCWAKGCLGACPRIHLCSGIGPRFSQGLGVSAWAPRSARTIPINPHRHCWTNAKS